MKVIKRKGNLFRIHVAICFFFYTISNQNTKTSKTLRKQSIKIPHFFVKGLNVRLHLYLAGKWLLVSEIDILASFEAPADNKQGGEGAAVQHTSQRPLKEVSTVLNME